MYEGFILLGYDTASVGNQIFMPSSSRVDLETEDTMLLQNTESNYPVMQLLIPE